MLVLTRCPGETIYIGEKRDIQIMVIKIKGNQVQIGIEAPKDIPVHRKEIADLIDNKKGE